MSTLRICDGCGRQAYEDSIANWLELDQHGYSKGWEFNKDVKGQLDICSAMCMIKVLIDEFDLNITINAPISVIENNEIELIDGKKRGRRRGASVEEEEQAS